MYVKKKVSRWGEGSQRGRYKKQRDGVLVEWIPGSSGISCTSTTLNSGPEDSNCLSLAITRVLSTSVPSLEQVRNKGHWIQESRPRINSA